MRRRCQLHHLHSDDLDECSERATDTRAHGCRDLWRADRELARPALRAPHAGAGSHGVPWARSRRPARGPCDKTLRVRHDRPVFLRLLLLGALTIAWAAAVHAAPDALTLLRHGRYSEAREAYERLTAQQPAVAAIGIARCQEAVGSLEEGA